MEWLWMIPVLPLLGALVQGILVLTKSANNRTSTVLGVGLPALSLSVTFAALWQYAYLQHPSPFEQILFPWSAGELTIEFSLLLDSLSATMIFIVTFVGLWIAIFAVGCEREETTYARFYSYLGLLQASVLLLVLAGNLLILLVGWQGVALSSYLLIGLRADDRDATRAAHQAFIVHRVGDLGLLLVIFAFFARFDSLRLRDIFEGISAEVGIAPSVVSSGSSWPVFIALALLLAAAVKSAQGPFFVWLIDASCAEAPASAFLHTIVVSVGVYLLLRFQSILELASSVGKTIAILGVTTALLAAAAAIAQRHIRRVLSFTTISQLGLIFAAIGLGAYSEALFHILAHCFFMAVLVMAAGSVGLALSGEQDLRRMGGLRTSLPWSSATFLVGSLGIAGFPALAGFFQHGAILSAIWQENKLIWLMALSSLLAISFSLFRVYWLVFWGERRGDGDLSQGSKDPSTTMTAALVALAGGSLLILWFGNLPFSSQDWLGGIRGFTLTSDSVLSNTGSLDMLLEIVLVMASITAAGAGILASWRIYGSDFALGIGDLWAERYPEAHRVLLSGYGIDGIYLRAIARPARSFSTWLNKAVDSWSIDGILRFLAFVPLLVAAIARNTTTGNTRHYALYFLAGALLLFLWVAL